MSVYICNLIRLISVMVIMDNKRSWILFFVQVLDLYYQSNLFSLSKKHKPYTYLDIIKRNYSLFISTNCLLYFTFYYYFKICFFFLCKIRNWQECLAHKCKIGHFFQVFLKLYLQNIALWDKNEQL